MKRTATSPIPRAERVFVPSSNVPSNVTTKSSPVDTSNLSHCRTTRRAGSLSVGGTIPGHLASCGFDDAVYLQGRKPSNPIRDTSKPCAVADCKHGFGLACGFTGEPYIKLTSDVNSARFSARCPGQRRLDPSPGYPSHGRDGLFGEGKTRQFAIIAARALSRGPY